MNDNDNPLEVMSTTALESISRAEVDMQIATAKRYPRDLMKVKQGMMSIATLDEETAASCFYTLPRGGKSIQGPSVRLAEVAASCYGNIRAGTRIIQVVTTGDQPHVVVQGVCHDLERNVSISMEKRRRIFKKKSAERIDEDDINLAANACSAIAYRDAVYKVVPGAFVKPVWEAARETATGNATTLVDRRSKAIAKFAKMGVTEAQVLAAVEKKSVDMIDLEALSVLIGLYTSIKDGQTTIDEAFPPADGKKPDIKGAVPKTATPPVGGLAEKAVNAPAQTATTPPIATPPPVETAKPAKEAKPKAEKAKAAPAPAPEPKAEPAAKETPPDAGDPANEATEAATESTAAPEESTEAPAEAAEEAPIHDQLRKFLTDHSVSEEEFMGWLENSGRYRNASKLMIDDLPGEFVTKLAQDGRALGKCVSLYGKAPAAPAA